MAWPGIVADARGALIVPVVMFFLVMTLILLLFAFRYGYLWVKAAMAGVHVAVFEIIGMRLRGIRPRVIIEARIKAFHAGIPIETRALEVHYLASGNVTNVARALIAAHSGGVALTFERACAIDLSGRDAAHEVERALKSGIKEL